MDLISIGPETASVLTEGKVVSFSGRVANSLPYMLASAYTSWSLTLPSDGAFHWRVTAVCPVPNRVGGEVYATDPSTTSETEPYRGPVELLSK